MKKTDLRIVAYGSVDEANSSIGVVLSDDLDPDIRRMLTKIQNDLFVVGSDLANPDMTVSGSRVTEEMVENIEGFIDSLELELDPINYFILPGGSPAAAQLHMTRAICRRAEVNAIKVSEHESINSACLIYLNRLSDLLFVMARTANKRKKMEDIAWEK